MFDACFAIVTYEGTGTTPSSSSPKSVTFNKALSLFVHMYSTYSSYSVPDMPFYYYNSALNMKWVTTSFKQQSQSTTGTWGQTRIFFKKSSDSKTIYWYLPNVNAFNETGIKYVLIGM